MSTVESRLRERVSFLEEQIAQMRTALANERDPYVAIGFTGQQGIALAVLMRGGTKTRDVIDAAMEAFLPTREGRHPQHVGVVVCKLRRRLEPHGVTVRTIYGQGFTMDPDSRARVAELCAAGRHIGAVREARS